MNLRKPLLFAISVLGLLVGSSSATAATLSGLAVGTKAPDFKLKDQAGKEHELSNLLKKGKVALVFYRSADW